jgi:hypothetical protein
VWGGHSVAWGGACQDCSPRILDPSEARFNLNYGVPTETEFGEAQRFLCGTANGMRCQQSLSSKYAEFHGPRNVYSAIVDTLCMDTKCTFGQGEAVFFFMTTWAGLVVVVVVVVWWCVVLLGRPDVCCIPAGECLWVPVLRTSCRVQWVVRKRTGCQRHV